VDEQIQKLRDLDRDAWAALLPAAILGKLGAQAPAAFAAALLAAADRAFWEARAIEATERHRLYHMLVPQRFGHKFGAWLTGTPVEDFAPPPPPEPDPRTVLQREAAHHLEAARYAEALAAADAAIPLGSGDADGDDARRSHKLRAAALFGLLRIDDAFAALDAGFAPKDLSAMSPETAKLEAILYGAYRPVARVQRKRAGRPADPRAAALRDLAAGTSAEDIQTTVYEVGKRHPFAALKDWFGCLYQVLLGQSEGPRFGGFVALYGIPETIALIEGALAR